MLIASWISDFATEYRRAVAIWKFVIILLHRDGRAHQCEWGLNLLVLPVHSFYPKFSSSSLDPSITRFRDQWILNFGLYVTPGELVEMHISVPQVLIWQAGNLCCWQVSQMLGLGPLWKVLAEVDALWDTRVQTLRTMASSQRVSTLCFFAGGLPPSPIHLEWIHSWPPTTCFSLVSCQLSK